MAFEITGKIAEIFPEQQVSATFRKREFVVESQAETKAGTVITDYIKFQLVQDKCNLIQGLGSGESVKVHFNIRGNRFEKDGKVSYFNNLDVWRIERGQRDQPSQDFPPLPSQAPPEEGFDDLPF